ncbi:hypothetical protein C0584_02750 [Candidatus Parcubacteria bacterium]|nr:MAG: hypothetical protein C0584_02750 [Candidatus Parcubacteria bacterium]
MGEEKGNLFKITTIIALISLALIMLLNFFNIPFFVIFALVLLFVITLINIEIGIYLIAFFLPLINLNFYFSSLQVPFIDLLAGAVFFVYLVKHFLARDFKSIELPHIFSFSLFFLAVILSSIFSENIYSSLWYSLRWILFFYLVYIVLPVNVIKNEKVLKNACVAFSFSVFLIALMGIYSILTQDWLNTIVRVRPISLFGTYPIGENQNLIVETLLPGVFILLALKYWIKDLRLKRFLNILIAFVATTLLLTFSRGAWLSLFLVSLLMSIVFYKKRLIKFIVPLFLVILIITPLIFYMINIQTTYDIGTTSNKSRLLLSEIAWDGFKDSPIVGKGTGEYLNLVANNIRFRANYGDPVDSHGVMQKILVENGAIGFLTFVVFVIAIFKSFIKFLKKEEYKEFYLPLVGAALSVSIFELFNTSYYKGKLWFVIALAIVSVRLIENKKSYEK